MQEKYGCESVSLTADGLVFTGKGIVKRITFNGPFGGSGYTLMTLTDDLDGLGTAKWVMASACDLPIAMTHEMNIRCETGAYIKFTGSGTVFWASVVYTQLVE